MTTLTLDGPLAAGIYTLVPAQAQPLWQTSFAPPATLAPLSNTIQPVQGVPILPWGSPPLCIQCLGVPSEHQHGIVGVASGGNALHLRMAAGAGSDQAALLVQPLQAVGEFYYKARVWLDAKLGTLLTPSQNWTEVCEWKTGGQGAAYGGDLRCKLEINMDSAKVLHWRSWLDTNANDPSVPVRVLHDSGFVGTVALGTWFTLEHYVRRSLGNDGLIWWKINWVELDRFAGPNFGERSAPINRLMLTNLYSAAYPQERYITDLELRSTLP